MKNRVGVCIVGSNGAVSTTVMAGVNRMGGIGTGTGGGRVCA